MSTGTELIRPEPDLQASKAKYFAAVALILSVGLCAGNPLQASATNAGLMQWSFNYHQTSVPVAIWYPTIEAATEIDAGPFTLTAASNAPLVEKKYPLLIISHGTGGSNIAHHPIAEALAVSGFMVAALTHPGDNYQDRSLVANKRYFDERPRQLVALLAALAQDEKLGMLIDTDRVGAIGHSAGGYAVAAMIGATPNRQNLIEHCKRVNDDPSCGYSDPALGVTSPATNHFSLRSDTTSIVKRSIPPVRSVALLAPLGSVIDATSSIDKSVSVKVVSAELDRILPRQYHQSRLQQVVEHGIFREAAGAGHFSFIAPINRPWKKQLGDVAEDPAGFDRHTFNEQLGQELAQWFSSTLDPIRD